MKYPENRWPVIALKPLISNKQISLFECDIEINKAIDSSWSIGFITNRLIKGV